MRIIKMKTINLFFCIFLVVFCILMFLIFVYMKTRNNEEVVQVMATPVSNKVIIIDSGHGRRRSGGAISKNKISESDINLKIALKLQNLLEQSGATVILTRSNEKAIYDLDSQSLRQKKVSDIKNRVKIGNESSADVFISIHLNKIPQEQYWGWQTFFKENDERSMELAKLIQENLNSSVGVNRNKTNNREALKISGIYIVDKVKIPIAIVECGFLSNAEEEKLLQQDSYQEELAWGIYTGIMDYFSKNIEKSDNI